jgi:hypothetical protein
MYPLLRDVSHPLIHFLTNPGRSPKRRGKETMGVLRAIGLIVVGLLTFHNMAVDAISKQQKEDPSSKAGLQISLVAPNSRYKRNERIKLHVMLTNVSYKDLYVLGSLEWGESASLLLHVRDASGKDIEPRAFPDSQIFVDTDDASSFLKFRPNHFLGTSLVSDVKFLNIAKPENIRCMSNTFPRYRIGLCR